MAMDSLTEWYRYIDQVSRPARRLADDEEELEQWRPWKPNDEAPPVEAAISAESIPDLSEALGLPPPEETRPLGTVEFVDLTLHDQLAPIPTFSAPSLSAPSFDIAIPRYGARPAPTAIPAPRSSDEPDASAEPAVSDFEARLARVFGSSTQSAADEQSEQFVADNADDDGEEGGGKSSGFRHWDLLSQIRSHDVAQNSYKSTFRETREELVQRLLDPPLTLEDTARLLGVCPTTVRRYTNKGQLSHFRTTGNQRRFRLSDVLEFLESRATEIEADARADREAGLDT